MFHLRLALVLALAPALLASGCSPSSDAGPYEPCDPSLPCTDQLQCRTPAIPEVRASGALCTKSCSTPDDCPTATTGGVARVCVIAPGEVTGTCFAYCATDVDCLPGTLCRVTRLATGEDSRVCVP